MKNYRQAIMGFLAAAVSIGILFGSLALAMVEANPALVLRASPTPADTSTSAPIPTTFTTTPTATAQLTLTQSPTTESSLTVSPTSSATPTMPVTVCKPPSQWIAVYIYPGDTLESLGAKYNVSVDALISANCLSSQILEPGTLIYVPPPPITQPTVACGHPAGWVQYTIQPGDTLYSLAQLLGVTVYDLQLANCMGTSVFLRAGQKLWVPFLPVKSPTPSMTPTKIPSPTSTQVPTKTPTTPPSSTPVPTDTEVPTNTPTTVPTDTDVPTATPTEATEEAAP